MAEHGRGDDVSCRFALYLGSSWRRTRFTAAQDSPRARGATVGLDATSGADATRTLDAILSLSSPSAAFDPSREEGRWSGFRDGGRGGRNAAPRIVLGDLPWTSPPGPLRDLPSGTSRSHPGPRRRAQGTGTDAINDPLPPPPPRRAPHPSP